MKWIALFLLPLTVHAGSKQDDYVKSCEASFVRIISRTQPNAKDKAPKLAKESCADMAANLTQRDKWATVQNPKLEACSDALYMLADDSLKEDSEAREKMTLAFCF